MACYLCAYLSEKQPHTPEPLPPGSPVPPYWALGVCARCSVAACSQHGTRYGRFECAICQPAAASERALIAPEGTPPGDGSMLALAHSIGERADDEQRQRMANALDRILEAAERTRSRGRDAHLLLTEALEDGEPNLVGNLAAEIRGRMDVERGSGEDFVAQVRADREESEMEWRVGVVQLDAIGARVADTFANRELHVDSASVVTLTGALLMAMATADRRNMPLAQDASPERVATTDVKEPWRVSHPVLLDPVMWLIATAYTS